MTRKKTKLDRGQVLATRVQASMLKKEEIAAKAGYSRSAYYKHIADPDLGFHILSRYGKAIQYDFTEEFPEMPRYLLHDEGDSDTPTTLSDALKQLQVARQKYVDILEKYNGLMQEQVEKLRKK